MSIRDQFTQEEWTKVMLGAGRTGGAVVAASPSGVTGLVAEAQAIAKTIRESVSGAARTPLLEAIAADLLGTPPDAKSLGGGERAGSMDEVRAQNLEGVRQAVWLVSSKASPEDAAAYRQMLLHVAERTAQAAKEDGNFLGMGGVQINEKEKTVLDELRRVIGGSDSTFSFSHETPPSAPSTDGSGHNN
ncbi:hypothetical protein SAMN04488058_104138 [Deinococcus reticulitermitis]|uniref:Uncharacterized protein n=1 Tax=Deinococcus reticulitermitis TaxID=856736 RepID=A0A1H6WQ49_9DEIO|nr:hypothetical protein [Deinococcus reticulitermitis]SEJ14870.1 hypothetical protein SAMN04488058_104138 [Deinococcus reticulitermitis]